MNYLIGESLMQVSNNIDCLYHNCVRCMLKNRSCKCKVVNLIILLLKCLILSHTQTADLEKEKEKTRRRFCDGKNCPVCRKDLSAEELSMDDYDDKLKKMHFGGERGRLFRKRGRGVGRRGRVRRGRPPPFVEKW